MYDLVPKKDVFHPAMVGRGYQATFHLERYAVFLNAVANKIARNED